MSAKSGFSSEAPLGKDILLRSCDLGQNPYAFRLQDCGSQFLDCYGPEVALISALSYPLLLDAHNVAAGFFRASKGGESPDKMDITVLQRVTMCMQ